MTHSFLPVSVRHPEVPRTHQRDEGSCVDLPQSLMFIRHRQGNSQCANMLRARSLARLEKAPSFGMTHSGGSTVTSGVQICCARDPSLGWKKRRASGMTHLGGGIVTSRASG